MKLEKGRQMIGNCTKKQVKIGRRFVFNFATAACGNCQESAAHLALPNGNIRENVRWWLLFTSRQRRSNKKESPDSGGKLDKVAPRRTGAAEDLVMYAGKPPSDCPTPAMQATERRT
ncbi:hypothetical protein RB195_019478 [Necator americanus]|uniref:Uncharacterized protein n=1 Tax=Necator americanus TaxID=51031 RepID=A0ABR1CED8_NECAM